MIFLRAKEKKGITLIALVITIIVLLILAAVTIGALTGDNGILTRASESKEKTEEAKKDEQKRLTALEAATNMEQTIHEENGIKVKIPKGFAVSQAEGENKIATGLVVVDSQGNEYVWVPVTKDEDGTPTDPYTESNGKLTKQDGTQVEIQLGRYSFNSTTGVPSAYYGPFTEDIVGNHNSEYKNIIAKDIEGFKESVKTNGGYYIGRYEAGIEGGTLTSEENSEKSTDWTGYTGDNMKLVSKSGATVWNYITQNRAANLCQNLANEYEGVTSDLINSYAWDTAIVYIQNCGTNNNYANQIGVSTTRTLSKAGETVLAEGSEANKNDVQCNIYDMAGNYREWVTETYNNSSLPCVYRGGSYHDSDIYTSARNIGRTTSFDIDLSFRPLLYLQI